MHDNVDDDDDDDSKRPRTIDPAIDHTNVKAKPIARKAVAPFWTQLSL